MSLIPIEDNFNDVVAKAQLGYGIADADLAARAEITMEDLAAVKAGEPRLAVLRRLARHLLLSPGALEVLAKKEAYPRAPVFPRGFALFNTPDGEQTVNNYLVWDPKSREAAVIDTGTDVSALLEFAAAERLRVKSILITHTHHDHVADLKRLAQATGAEVWSSDREPIDYPGARTFTANDYFHLGSIAIKALSTWGHSPGLTTFYVQGLSWPLALCGDALFSASIGGSATHFREQIKNTRSRLFSLPKDTVIGPGHGPLTTLAHERKYNPFFAPERIPEDKPRVAKKPESKKAGRPSKAAKPSSPGKPAFHSRRTRSA